MSAWTEQNTRAAPQGQAIPADGTVPSPRCCNRAASDAKTRRQVGHRAPTAPPLSSAPTTLPARPPTTRLRGSRPRLPGAGGALPPRQPSPGRGDCAAICAAISGRLSASPSRRNACSRRRRGRCAAGSPSTGCCIGASQAPGARCRNSAAALQGGLCPSCGEETKLQQSSEMILRFTFTLGGISRQREGIKEERGEERGEEREGF
jgi:hypothetical protein